MSTQITESLSVAVQKMALDVAHFDDVITLINERTDTPRLIDGGHVWIVQTLVHKFDETPQEYRFMTFSQAFICWLNMVTGNNPGAGDED